MLKKITLLACLFTCSLPAHNLPPEKLEEIKELSQKYRQHEAEKAQIISDIVTGQSAIVITFGSMAFAALAHQQEHFLFEKCALGVAAVGTILYGYYAVKVIKPMLFPKHPEPFIDNETRAKILLYLKSR